MDSSAAPGMFPADPVGMLHVQDDLSGGRVLSAAQDAVVAAAH